MENVMEQRESERKITKGMIGVGFADTDPELPIQVTVVDISDEGALLAIMEQDKLPEIKEGTRIKAFLNEGEADARWELFGVIRIDQKKLHFGAFREEKMNKPFKEFGGG